MTPMMRTEIVNALERQRGEICRKVFFEENKGDGFSPYFRGQDLTVEQQSKLDKIYAIFDNFVALHVME